MHFIENSTGKLFQDSYTERIMENTTRRMGVDGFDVETAVAGLKDSGLAPHPTIEERTENTTESPSK